MTSLAPTLRSSDVFLVNFEISIEMLPKGTVDVTRQNHFYIPGMWKAPGSACGLLEAGVTGAGFGVGVEVAGTV